MVDGSASLGDFFEYFHIISEENEVSTVNGWVMLQTDKIPEKGDSFSFENLDAVVISTDGKRADKIRITVNEKKENEDVSE